MNIIIKLRNWIIHFVYDLIFYRRLGAGKVDFRKDDIKKILIVRKDNVGDLICTTPVFANLRHNFPNAYIAAFVISYTAFVVEGNPNIDKIYLYEKHKHTKNQTRLRSWWNMYKTIRAIQKEGFDLGLSMMANFSNSQAWLVYISKARYRAGYIDNPLHKFNFFYNLPIVKPKILQNEVEKNLNLLKSLDLEITDKDLWISISHEYKDKIKNALKTRGILNDLIVNFHLSDRMQPWPIERFVELGNRLSELYNAGLILTWAPGDELRKAQVEQGLKKPPLSYSTKDFKELGGTIQASDLFITVEGGPMHQAMALNIPTIAIFGKTKFVKEWAPWGDHGYYIDGHGHTSNVTVEDVLKKVREVLKIKKINSERISSDDS